MMFSGSRRGRSLTLLLGGAWAMTLLACGSPTANPEPTPVPDPTPVTPIAHSQILQVRYGHPLAITLFGEAGAGEMVTYAIEDAPRHGRLEGTAPELTYVSPAGFIGHDVFTFTVRVGERTSSKGVVLVEVRSSPFYTFSQGSFSRESVLYFTDEWGALHRVGETMHALTTLKFDPTTGILFAATRNEDVEGHCSNCLVTLDLETGAATVVGLLKHGNRWVGPITSMAFTSDGTLYGLLQEEGFVKIDKTSGAITLLEEPLVHSLYGHAMWADQEDTLWFLNGDGAVFTVSKETGELTLIQDRSVLIDGFNAPGDIKLRGDFDPVAGIFWGLWLGGDGRVAQIQIDGEEATFLTFVDVRVPDGAHNLALAP